MRMKAHYRGIPDQMYICDILCLGEMNTTVTFKLFQLFSAIHD